MKKILLVFVFVVCLIALFPICFGGETLAGLVLGNPDLGELSYQQVFENLVQWFEGLGTFFRSVFEYIRDFGLLVAEAWENLEEWFLEKVSAVKAGFDNILNFFGINADSVIGGNPSE